MDKTGITLKELWNLLVRRILVMLLVGVTVMLGAFAVGELSYTQKYASTATLYIQIQRSDDSISEISSDYSLSLKIVNDCTYMLKSHIVLSEVIDDLDLPLEYEELYHRVSTANPADTRFLTVTVRADTPEGAKAIVDRLCEVGSARIESTMSYAQVTLFEYGVLDTRPSGRMGFPIYVLIGAAAAVLTYAVCLVIHLKDDRHRTPAAS